VCRDGIRIESDGHMSDDSFRRLDRLATRAKKLDDVIKRAAEMQKQIVEEIRQIGRADRVTNKKPTRTPLAGTRRHAIKKR
jgi:hypothetical protein